MSSSNCCFLTCIQISQESGQVVQYSHPFQNFPQFFLVHTVKGFGIVNKAEIDVFLGISCFFNDPMDVGNLISGSSAFSKSSLNIWKFLVHILLKPYLENFEHYFASMWDECNGVYFEYSLALSSFGIRMKTDLFQSCGPCWVYENPRDEGAWWASIYGVAQSRTRLKRLSSSSSSWHIECSIFTASSFRIWNSSAGIPSPPLALFIVMLLKAHWLHIPGSLALGEWSHHRD